MDNGEDYILLKWGTVKGWSFSSDKSKKSLEILQRYHDLGSSISRMMQHDTDEQKEILYELIRQHVGTIYNDWSGERYTIEQAIEYIKNYGKE